MPPGARAILLAGMAARASSPILAIVAGEREAEDLAQDVSLFTADVAHFPAWETLPFEHVSPNLSTMASRIEARYRLQGADPFIVHGLAVCLKQQLECSVAGNMPTGDPADPALGRQ